MGTLYTIIPLDQKCAEWLDAQGVSHPPIRDTARYPTPREISEVLNQLPNSEVTIDSDAQSGEWSATVDPEGNLWAHIRILDLRSEETPHEFYFSKGSPEVVLAITERLAQHCGTLVVVDDGSGRPIVVAHVSDTKV